MLVTYNYEFKKKLKVGFIGRGFQKDIFPVFQYVPPVRRTQTGAENTK